MQTSPHNNPHTPVRADGIDARRRLVDAGLRLFAQKGYQQTSIREVALAAQVNVAAISYYFGDKAGLYRAVFRGPDGMNGHHTDPRMSDPSLPLAQRLRYFYETFLEPLKHGDEVRLLIKLHYREMIEPTGAWQEAIDNEIRPCHDELLQILVKELGLRRVDLDLQRLAFCVLGIAIHFFACQPVVESISPQVIANTRSIDTLAERLALFAEAMIEAERSRRTALLESHDVAARR